MQNHTSNINRCLSIKISLKNEETIKKHFFYCLFFIDHIESIESDLAIYEQHNKCGH